MAKEHGLYIPDLDYVSDLGGLVGYLGEKVGTGNACLYCNKIFRDAEAVANHMRSLSHAKLKYDDDDLDEYEEFYDFSKTWEGVEGESEFDENEDITPEQQQQLILKSGKGIVDIDDDGYSLTLANGKRIGHRDLAVFYKQNFSSIARRDPETTKAVLNKYKALGWKTKVSDKQRIAQRHQQRKYFTEQMQVGVKSNRLQKYFREQVLY
uniref:C2H2-type domain-containing protein n=2 Tax=Vannella robusta TaxID=1487602 RepID=A0A7S4IFI7_9EUKA|mmetsp:Transcript_25064/g.31887  ORF Transcript_25064/g.31887 Transcript_25064/m.31887 type:complete len:209 (+) Transcript_25064:566-1192(+)